MAEKLKCVLGEGQLKVNIHIYVSVPVGPY